MKKVLIALGFTFVAMSSQATVVFNFSGLTVPTNAFNDILSEDAGAVYEFGTLSADAGDVITFTNLISDVEASFNNFFVNDMQVFSNKEGDSNSFNFTVLNSGVLDFQFVSQGGFIDSNGSQNIAVLSDVENFNGEFLLLLDDSFVTHMDFDDHAVGVSTVSAVPVPAALPLMATALGAFGIARRLIKIKLLNTCFKLFIN